MTITKIKSCERSAGAGILMVESDYTTDKPEGRVYLILDGTEEIWVDADELRDAIDKAVGKREGAKGSDPKPYRPIDRDRLLRHIEDIEAALARRNERWERDQERIRELSAEVSDLQAQAEEPAAPKPAREYLGMAWEAAHVPADGMIHEGESVLARDASGIRQGACPAGSTFPAERYGIEHRLLDPRVEPTEEEGAAEALSRALIDSDGWVLAKGERESIAAQLAAEGWRKVEE